jgi:large subunit ribosomal protein L21
MYAIVKTGGKQYRVSEGESLLVERLPDAEGATVRLDPLLCVDGENITDGAQLRSMAVSATVLGHERGPKLRIVKFKPKRGYKRRTGHRQELTRIRIDSIGSGSEARSGSGATGRAERSRAGTRAATADHREEVSTDGS